MSRNHSKILSKRGMNPIADTAYYCCGVRMEDAKRIRPVCNDVYAERFMDERGRKIFEPFRSERMANISNIVRCRLIDEYLIQELLKNSRATIVTIGAGFDTRPYRLTGGNWIEIDEPQIIDHKNERLPAEECPNPLRRLAIDFARDELRDRLGDELKEKSRTKYTVVVIEGVFMYLGPESIEATMSALQEVHPRHVLYCDLMTERFFARFAQSIHAKIAASGSTFAEQHASPEEIFLERGYRAFERIPMFRGAGELGLLWDELKIPKLMAWLMLNVFARDLQGYAVHRLSYEGY